VTNPACPYCGSTLRYTDPQLQVRCTNCFQHLDGEPDTPIGRMQDLEAPTVITPPTPKKPKP
jgi:tRNA(Ile2) C34 agmatinyltransferase TiaS